MSMNDQKEPVTFYAKTAVYGHQQNGINVPKSIVDAGLVKKGVTYKVTLEPVL